ncbi:MAG: flagellar basal-body rod protein FlgG [Ignavibacteriales bacterium]|jgi:flagellar basal-body rod protein FlgG|nr:flagellar basal-body rod protein FlgG [Ignavibacteriales bacterium]
MPYRALLAAASGMNAQQTNIEVISNNIANVNTTGFKKSRAEFQDLIYQEVAAHPLNSYLPGVIETPTQTIQIGTGVRLASTDKNHLQGDLHETGNQFDVAIHGEGFFQLRRPDGTFAYTRDGSFKLSADGSIVTSNGFVLEPGLLIDEEAMGLQISREGVVSLVYENADVVEVGEIELAKFVNPSGLRAVGDNMFLETDSSGVPMLGMPGEENFGQLHQGFLESSNVDIVDEMVSMITAQRSYEINSKTVKTVEDMMSIANNLKRT